MNHNTSLREPRQYPSSASTQHESLVHARIRQAMPDLDDAAVERLAGICTELPPPGKPAANTPEARLYQENLRYYASRRGLAGLANGQMQDRQHDLAAMDWLMLSIRMAAEDDASSEWILALCEIGSGWVSSQEREFRDFEAAYWEAVLATVEREEGGA